MRTHFHPHLRRWHIILPALLSLALLVSLCLGAAQAAPLSVITCQELIVDGGFESGAGWTQNLSGVPTAYVSIPTFSGDFAMRLGLVEGFNRPAYSSIQQEITLPVAAQTITLSFRVYPLSEPFAGADEQYLALLDPISSAPIAQPWQALSNGQAWSEEVIDLTLYRGQTLLLYFNVLNDGDGGRTAMYLDDISLQVCTASTATPSATATATDLPTGTATSTPPDPTATTTATAIPPTATATATATAQPPTATATAQAPTATDVPPSGPCQLQCLPNGDFENYDHWWLGPTQLYPDYISGKGIDGSQAIRLGNIDQNNVQSYSSVRQNVNIPTWPQRVLLNFWYWPISAGADVKGKQELLLLHPPCAPKTATRLWETRRNDQQWLQQP